MDLASVPVQGMSADGSQTDSAWTSLLVRFLRAELPHVLRRTVVNARTEVGVTSFDI
jgi:hypothetical protein